MMGKKTVLLKEILNSLKKIEKRMARRHENISLAQLHGNSTIGQGISGRRRCACGGIDHT